MRGERLLSFPASLGHDGLGPGRLRRRGVRRQPGLRQAHPRIQRSAAKSEEEERQKEYEDLDRDKSFKSGDMDATRPCEGRPETVGRQHQEGRACHLSISIRTCGEGSFHLDSCPTAEGKVEGGDQTEIELAVRATEGSKLVLAQGFKSVAETTLKGQTGDDGKLDYYDIKHVFELSGTTGGTQVNFGPITVDTTYIGEARIDMRRGNSKRSCSSST